MILSEHKYRAWWAENRERIAKGWIAKGWETERKRIANGYQTERKDKERMKGRIFHLSFFDPFSIRFQNMRFLSFAIPSFSYPFSVFSSDRNYRIVKNRQKPLKLSPIETNNLGQEYSREKLTRHSEAKLVKRSNKSIQALTVSIWIKYQCLLIIISSL